MSGGTELYFEIVKQGAFAKCTAIDPRTGQEASVVGPSRGHDEQLKATAARKLQRLLTGR